MTDKPADCEQPEHVTCALAENGWNEYKRLVLASMDSLHKAVNELRKENQQEHQEIHQRLNGHADVVNQRFAKVERTESFRWGQIVGGGLAGAFLVSVIGAAVAVFVN